MCAWFYQPYLQVTVICAFNLHFANAIQWNEWPNSSFHASSFDLMQPTESKDLHFICLLNRVSMNEILSLLYNNYTYICVSMFFNRSLFAVCALYTRATRLIQKVLYVHFTERTNDWFVLMLSTIIRIGFIRIVTLTDLEEKSIRCYILTFVPLRQKRMPFLDFHFPTISEQIQIIVCRPRWSELKSK